jgi:hypothetical protein
MELRIKGSIDQIEKIVPVIGDMQQKGFINWGNPKFIAPFQYGDKIKDAAVIKLTANNNLSIDCGQVPPRGR